MIKELEVLLANESKSWALIQSMKESFDPRLFNDVTVKSTEEAFEKGTEIVKAALNVCEVEGIDYKNASHGHSIGHLTRDYIHALILANEMDIDPKHLFVGFVGAVLHDSGCTLVKRFEESHRVVRHAEAGSLLFKSVAKDLDLNDAEKLLISYAIAAHTNYLTSDSIKCFDGKMRHVMPYTDLSVEGQPLIGVILPRWVDRLDCSGPCFISRNYLNLLEDHVDYDGHEHFGIEYAAHLQPRLLSEPERRAKKLPHTMREYLKLFTDSQTNDSPYGKYDFGAMVTLRDDYKKRLLHIIDVAQGSRELSSDGETIDTAWELFLSRNIEPTERGAKAAQQLRIKYGQLDDHTRKAWQAGFLATMNEYISWSGERILQLDQLEKRHGSNILSLPGITDDVREVIRPYAGWVELIN
jgi:hypothetical protein